MNNIIPFFELTLPNGDICKFGNRHEDIEPRVTENRFVYTFTISNNAGRYEVTLIENTIGAALQEMALYVSEHHITFWWNVPPTIQWDMEDEAWTVEQLMGTTIGDHLDLCMTIVEGPELTLVDTYIAPLLQDDIVEEYQMDTTYRPTLHDQLVAWHTRQAPQVSDPTLPPLYAHTATGQDADAANAANAADAQLISTIIINKATELLSTHIAMSVLD